MFLVPCNMIYILLSTSTSLYVNRLYVTYFIDSVRRGLRIFCKGNRFKKSVKNYDQFSFDLNTKRQLSEMNSLKNSLKSEYFRRLLYKDGMYCITNNGI